MDLEIQQEDNRKVSDREITKDGRRIFIWIEESKEPTEHILNELYQRKEEFEKLGDRVILIIKNKEMVVTKVLCFVYGCNGTLDYII